MGNRLQYLLDDVKAVMKDAGFDVVKTYRFLEHQYHLFFVLRIHSRELDDGQHRIFADECLMLEFPKVVSQTTL